MEDKLKNAIVKLAIENSELREKLEKTEKESNEYRKWWLHESQVNSVERTKTEDVKIEITKSEN